MSGTHGNPWDVLPMSHVGQYERIDVQGVVHMGIPGMFYLCPMWDSRTG